MRDQRHYPELEEVEVSTDLFLASVDALRDSQTREPTLLPDWTRGHLITHMSRAAESLCRLLDWARTGVEQQQYASPDARTREIEAGARRSVQTLAADMRATATLFDDTVRGLPEAAWSVEVTTPTGEPRTPRGIVFIRLRELEIHHVDLAVGYAFADIPEPVAASIIDDIVTTVGAREGVASLRLVATDVELDREIGSRGPVVSGVQADLLAWLSGRSPGTGLTVKGAPEIPAAPTWI
jgi:maleylpyruvate isomerase